MASLSMLLALAAPAAFLAAAAERRDLRLGDPVAGQVALARAAELWGFDLVLDRDLQPAELRVDLAGVTRDEALDLLTVPARWAWREGEGGSVHVVPSIPHEVDEVTRRVRRAWRLERADPSEVGSALRSFAGAFAVAAGSGEVEVELPENLVGPAEQVVAAMEREGDGWSLEWTSTGVGIRSGGIDATLADRRTARLWFAEPAPVERLLAAIESAWDVELVLEPGIVTPGTATLRLPEATLFEALDALTLPAGWLWTPLGGRRILVAEASPASRDWAPAGLGLFPLRRSDPHRVRRLLQDLGASRVYVGRERPLVLARESPERLAIVEMVVETLEGGGPLAQPAGGRLWLGTRGYPRTAELQLLVDPATPAALRRTLAAAPPVRLRDGDAAWRPPAPDAADRGRRIGPLLDELAVHLVLAPCCGTGEQTLRRMTLDPRRAADRASAARALDGERAPRLTPIGPDTAILSPPGDYSRRLFAPWGVAAVPLGHNEAAVRELADELPIDAAWWHAEPASYLFASGHWDDLGALLAVAAGVEER